MYVSAIHQVPASMISRELRYIEAARSPAHRFGRYLVSSIRMRLEARRIRASARAVLRLIETMPHGRQLVVVLGRRDERDALARALKREGVRYLSRVEDDGFSVVVFRK